MEKIGKGRLLPGVFVLLAGLFLTSSALAEGDYKILADIEKKFSHM